MGNFPFNPSPSLQVGHSISSFRASPPSGEWLLESGLSTGSVVPWTVPSPPHAGTPGRAPGPGVDTRTQATLQSLSPSLPGCSTPAPRQPDVCPHHGTRHPWVLPSAGDRPGTGAVAATREAGDRPGTRVAAAIQEALDQDKA